MGTQHQKKYFCHQINGFNQKVRTFSQLARKFQLNQNNFNNDHDYILKFKQNVVVEKSKSSLSPKSTNSPFFEIPQRRKKSSIIEDKSKLYLPEMQRRKSNKIISTLSKKTKSPFKGRPQSIIQNKQNDFNENNALRFQQLNRQFKSNLDNWANKDSTQERIKSKDGCLRFGDLFQHEKVRIKSNNRMFQKLLQENNVDIFNKKESEGQFTKIAKGSTHKKSQPNLLKQSISNNMLQDTQPKQGLFKKQIQKNLQKTNLTFKLEDHTKKTKKLSFESLSMNKLKDQILIEFKSIMKNYFPQKKNINNQEQQIKASKKQKIANKIITPLLISFCKQQTPQISNIIDSIPNIIQNINNMINIQNIPIQMSMKIQKDQKKNKNQINNNQLRNILGNNSNFQKIQQEQFQHENQIKKPQFMTSMTSLQANDRVILSSLGSPQQLQFTMSPRLQ